MTLEKALTRVLNKIFSERLLLFYCVGILFFIPYAYFNDMFGHYSNSNDYLFFYYLTQNKCYSPYLNCEYKPLYLYITSGLENETLFFLFNLSLLIIVIPLILLKINNSNWILLLYFFGISFIHNILYAGIFPQLIISIFFLLILAFRKQLILHSILIILGALTHSYGGIFLLIIVLINWLFIKIKKFMNKPLKIGAYPFPVISMLVDKKLHFAPLDLLIKWIPFPFTILGINELIKRKDLLLISILLMSILGAFLISIRILLFSELILIIPLSFYLPKTRRNFKLLTLIVLMLYSLLSFIWWTTQSLSLFLGKSLI